MSDFEYEGGVDESLPFSDTAQVLDLAWPVGDVVVAYDLFLNGSHQSPQDIVIELEVLSGNIDLGMALFESDNPDGESTQSLGDAEVVADDGGPGAPESLTYSTGNSDVFGLVIFNQNAAAGTYRIRTFDPDLVATEVEASSLPRELKVSVDRNPLRQGTNVRFGLPEASPVDIRVFDVSEGLVRTLASGHHTAGHHSVRWDGRGPDGARVGAGIYFVRLEAVGETRVTKVVQSIGS